MSIPISIGIVAIAVPLVMIITALFLNARNNMINGENSILNNRFVKFGNGIIIIPSGSSYFICLAIKVT